MKSLLPTFEQDFSRSTGGKEMTTDERLAEIRALASQQCAFGSEDVEFLLDELVDLEVDSTHWQQRLNASEKSLREALLEIARLKTLHEWQSIETAPKDGRFFQVKAMAHRDPIRDQIMVTQLNGWRPLDSTEVSE